MKKLFLIFFILISNISYAKSVLIISSYSQEYEWANLCINGILDELNNDFDINIFYMNTKRIPPEQFQKKANQAWEIYLKEKPDLVMLGDDNALKLLGNKFGKTSTPVVYYGINNNPRKYFNSNYTNITGVLERPPILLYNKVLARIMPNVKKSLILFENTTSSRIDASIFDNQESIWIDDLRVDHKVINNWENWKETILKLNNEYGFIILSGFFSIKDKNGVGIKETDVVEWTNENSKIPIFTNHDYTVHDEGAVGAMTIQGYTHGKLAGMIAVDILKNNKTPKNILPKTDNEAKLYFNLKQLDEFKIVIPPIYKKGAVFQ